MPATFAGGRRSPSSTAFCIEEIDQRRHRPVLDVTTQSTRNDGDVPLGRRDAGRASNCSPVSTGPRWRVVRTISVRVEARQRTSILNRALPKIGPTAIRQQILIRILWIDLFDVKILIIDIRGRQAPAERPRCDRPAAPARLGARRQWPRPCRPECPARCQTLGDSKSQRCGSFASSGLARRGPRPIHGPGVGCARQCRAAEARTERDGERSPLRGSHWARRNDPSGDRVRRAVRTVQSGAGPDLADSGNGRDHGPGTG